jgi:hypothetical protein
MADDAVENAGEGGGFGGWTEAVEAVVDWD